VIADEQCDVARGRNACQVKACTDSACNDDACKGNAFNGIECKVNACLGGHVRTRHHM
jgi:hypothetical protein